MDTMALSSQSILVNSLIYRLLFGKVLDSILIFPTPSLALSVFYTSIQRTFLSTYHMLDILLDAGSFGFLKGTAHFIDGLTDNGRSFTLIWY